MVSVKNVSKSFIDDAGELSVIRDATFDLAQGEMVALVGISGSGKTTLLQIIGGLDVPTHGQVVIDGKDIGKIPASERALFRNKNLGFVFQFHHLLPDFTALENVMIPGLIAGITKTKCSTRAKELLDILGVAARGTHFPSEMSGGERQRVALARALFNEPALILADEPTGALDKENSEQLIELFTRANRELGQTFFIATHNERLSKSLHRTMYIEGGTVIENRNLSAP